MYIVQAENLNLRELKYEAVNLQTFTIRDDLGLLSYSRSRDYYKCTFVF